MEPKSSLLILFTIAATCVDSRGADWVTRQNRGVLAHAAHAVSNGVPGGFSPASRLMISAVAATSAQGGRVTIVNTQEWARVYAGPGHYDQALASVVDISNHLTVTGGSYAPSTGLDFVTVRYTPDGIALWTNRYDGPAHGQEFARGIAADGVGNLFVAGDSQGQGSGADIALIKYSPAGLPIWTNRYSTAGAVDDYPRSLAVDAAGNAYVAIFSYYQPIVGHPNPADQSVIVKYDVSGAPVWTNCYPALQLTLDPLGDLIVAGRGDNPSGFLAAKFRTDGTLLWTNVYFGSGNEMRALAADSLGNIILTGDTGYDYYSTVAFATDGVILWTNRLAHPGYQGGNVPMVTGDLAGNVFVTGGSGDANGDDADFTTLKISRTGSVLWTNRFWEANRGNPAPGGTATDQAGNFYLTGHSTGPSSANSDIFLVKYASNGTRLWTHHYNGPANGGDIAAAISIGSMGDIYVSGLTDDPVGVWNCVTVKFSDFILYTPPTNFVGTDTFTFTATDAADRSATGSVSVCVGPPPRLETSASGFGFGDAGLHLRVSGAFGTNPIILQASTNLTHWEPVWTNPPTFGEASFLDSAARKLVRRFYRALQPD